MERLQPYAFGMAAGLLWGVGQFIMAVFAILTASYAVGWVQFVGQFYLGYDATWLGALIGTAWGFLDGFIGGFVLAWLYNRFV